MTAKQQGITISKLDAARHHLSAAIRLWFETDDLVSPHSLAYAAYEVVHVLSKNHDRFRRDLLFDSDWIKDEYRSDFNKMLKSDANFFKRANRDAGNSIEFHPIMTELFILFTIIGLELMNEKLGDEVAVFFAWLAFNRPELLTEAGRDRYLKGAPIDHLNEIRAIPKPDFFRAFLENRERLRGEGLIK